MDSTTTETTVNSNESTVDEMELGDGTKTYRKKLNTTTAEETIKISCQAVVYDPSSVFYVPSQLAIISFTNQQAKTLRDHGQKLTESMKGLHAAIRGENLDEVGVAKEAIIASLEGQGFYNAAQGPEEQLNICEVIDLPNQQVLFCHKDVMEKFTKTASNNGRVITLNDRKTLTQEHLKTLVQDEIKKMKWSAECNISAEGQVKVAAPFDAWVGNLTQAMNSDPDAPHNGTTGLYDYTATAETAIMRYYAGASVATDLNLAEGKFSLQGQGKLDFSVLDTKVKGQLMIPSKEGYHLSIFNPPRDPDKKPTLVPKAVVELPKTLFDFDSSFVRPDMLGVLKSVEQTWMNTDSDAKLQLVGHTDKVGTDRYNMGLGERRAKSVYAYITNDVGYWESLYTTEENKRWGYRILKVILMHVLIKMEAEAHFSTDYWGKIKEDLSYEWYQKGKNDDGSNTSGRERKAIKWFQANSQLKVDGMLGKVTRRRLFAAYMLGPDDIKLDADRFTETHLITKGATQLEVKTNNPEEKNRRVELIVYGLINKPEEIDLGHLRCVLDVEANAYLGANIVGGVDVVCEVDVKQLKLRGTKRPKPTEELRLQAVSSQDVKDLADQSKTFKADIDTENGSIEGTRVEEQVTGKKSTSMVGSKGEHSEFSYTKTEEASQTATTSDGITVGLNGSINKNTTRSTVETDTRTTTMKKSDGINTSESTQSIGHTIKNETVTNTTANLESGTAGKETTRSYDNKKAASVNGTKEQQVNGPEGVKAGATVTASMFAGAKAGGDFAATIQWRSVEKGSEFVDLAKAGGGAHGTVGVECEFECSVRFEEGRFYLGYKVAAAWGIGAGSNLMCEVNLQHIFDFVIFVYTELRDCNFNYLAFIEGEAFELMNAMMMRFIVLNKQLDVLDDVIEEIFSDSDAWFDDARDWWNEPKQNAYKDKADNILLQIRDESQAIIYCPPEVRGRLLNVLCGVIESDSAFNTSFNEEYEEAIRYVLSWVQSKNDLKNVLNHMEVGSTHADVASVKTERVQRNYDRLITCLDGYDEFIFKAWMVRLPDVAKTSKDGPVKQTH